MASQALRDAKKFCNVVGLAPVCGKIQQSFMFKYTQDYHFPYYEETTKPSKLLSILHLTFTNSDIRKRSFLKMIVRYFPEVSVLPASVRKCHL